MRSLDVLKSAHEGDLLMSIVWLAIIQSNVAHLDSAGAAGAYDALDAVPPDEVRRPVSVLAVADMVGLPYETTRRQVEKLVARGECRRIDKGVIVPAQSFLDARRRDMVRTNMSNLRRLFRSLKARGVKLA